ncbi:MAG: hypothetical protein AAB540_02710 [Patescibacteria group bacterium]
MERGDETGGVDRDKSRGEAQICYLFTEAQLGFLLNIRLTKEEAYANVRRTIAALGYNEAALMFRLWGDFGLNMRDGGEGGHDVLGCVIQNSYEGKGDRRRVNAQKIVDLVFQLKEEAEKGAET